MIYYDMLQASNKNRRFFAFSGPLASIFFVADAYPPRRDELLLEIKFSRGVFSQLQPLVKVVG